MVRAVRRLQRPDLGLRARVTLAFAGGAFLLSAALSGVSYGLVRNYLVEQTQTAALRQAVNAGRPSRMAYRLTGTSQLAIGLPIPAVDAVYYEVFSLDQLDRTLRFLGVALLGAGLATTVAGAAVGRWASARVLRPVAEVA